MEIFNIKSNYDFESKCLEVFKYQSANCPVYKQYIELLGINPNNIVSYNQIPMLPIRFFKTKKIITSTSNDCKCDVVFTSSATTGMTSSKHYVKDLEIYKQSFTEGFRFFYGEPKDFVILSLLPSYLERKGSSLVYMAENLMNMASDGGFYLYNHRDLYEKLEHLKESKQKTILLGVTFALLDFIKEFKIDFPDLIVMETGGMKGRGKEIPRTELHSTLCESFGVQKIHSEYGMAELLSQAYSKGDGIFSTPPWMRVVISEVYDPFMRLNSENISTENNSDDYVQGRVNIIDLANINSCSFIETEDKGRQYANHFFTIDGRLKEAELRGCNMLLND